jgi:hypothetical protein
MPQYHTNPRENIKKNILEKTDINEKSPKRAKTNEKIKQDYDLNTNHFEEKTNLSVDRNSKNNEDAPTKNFMGILDKFKNLIQNARNDLKNENVISEFDEVHQEIIEIYQSFQKGQRSPIDSNKDFIKNLDNNKYSSVQEPTSLNLELIEGSSERRKSIYKKFFDICQASVKDISLIFNAPLNFSNNITTNMPINIDKSITNNVTNNNNNSKNNRVQVNVNLNFKNIRNISPIRKEKNHKSNKKHKSKRFYDEADENSVDLNESQTQEGVSNVLPHKKYMVQKPRDDWVNYKIFTEGDVQSDESEGHNLKAKKPFVKIRSKSQLNLNTLGMRASLDVKNEEVPQHTLKGKIMPDSQNIVTESEGENCNSDECSDSDSQISDEEKISRKTSENTQFSNNSKNEIINKLTQQNTTTSINEKDNSASGEKQKIDNKCLIF